MVRGIATAAFVAWVAFSSACAPSVLTSYGRGVQVHVGGDATSDRCVFVSPITARVGANFQTLRANMHNAVVEARNRAGLRGADWLYVQIVPSDGCKNCVTVTGMAYRCGQ